jgi:DNA-binding response OmpR family regulator
MGTILLADDDAAVRDLVKRALASDGHTVHAAEDGTEGLKVLDAFGPGIGIIVTDLDMPGLDGISLAKEARARNPNIAIIFMSAFADQLDRTKSLGQGRLMSITKPFSLEQIKQLVRAVAG